MREETKQKIFIIGCGGTGSNYIKELARYLATNRNYMINADVILIDGDTVEEKNLERQSFTPEDLLMNKAEAMALAVSDMYNPSFILMLRMNLVLEKLLSGLKIIRQLLHRIVLFIFRKF